MSRVSDSKAYGLLLAFLTAALLGSLFELSSLLLRIGEQNVSYTAELAGLSFLLWSGLALPLYLSAALLSLLARQEITRMILWSVLILFYLFVCFSYPVGSRIFLAGLALPILILAALDLGVTVITLTFLSGTLLFLEPFAAELPQVSAFGRTISPRFTPVLIACLVYSLLFLPGIALFNEKLKGSSSFILFFALSIIALSLSWLLSIPLNTFFLRPRLHAIHVLFLVVLTFNYAAVTWLLFFKRKRSRLVFHPLVVTCLLLVGGSLLGWQMTKGRDHRLSLRAELQKLPTSNLLHSMVVTYKDSDWDGYGSFDGIPDCHDTDFTVNPGALEIPGDGIDNNCIGGDLTAPLDPYFQASWDLSQLKREVGAKPRLAVLLVVEGFRDHSRLISSLSPHVNESTLVFETARSHSNNLSESLPYLLSLRYQPLAPRPLSLPLTEVLTTSGVKTLGLFDRPLTLRKDASLAPLLEFSARFEEPSEGGKKTILSLVQTLDTELSEFSSDDMFAYLHISQLPQATTSTYPTHGTVNALNLSSDLFHTLLPGGFQTKALEVFSREEEKLTSQLAPLVEILQARKQTHEVLLITTSPFGTALGEHGGFSHGGTLFEEEIRVPLLLFSSRKLAKLDTSLPVALSNIPATLLDFYGFQHPSLRNLSLLRADREARLHFASFSGNRFIGRSFSTYENDKKIIFKSKLGTVERYHLGQDPQETMPLFSPENNDLQRLDQLLFFMKGGEALEDDGM